MTKNLLLIDVSYQSYRACAVHPLLKDSEDVFTGGLYGFWMNLAKAARETQATCIVACLDVKPYIRSRDYSEYKLLRASGGNDELRKQHMLSMPMICASLQSVGIEPWGVPGFESDDLIGWAARRNKHRFANIYAMSNDSDLYQLFDDVPNFHVYNKDIGDLWNASKLKTTLGITGAEYALATALTGTHNDIAGIAKVGMVTAVKAIRDPGRMRDLRAKHGALIDRNIDLIKLPHAELPHLVMPINSPASSRSLYKSLGRYDIDVTASMMAAIDQIQHR